MINGKRKIDIGFIIKTKDDNGKVMTRTLADGKVVPDPMITTRNFGVPDDVEMRVSLWDLDAEVLMPLMSGNPTPEERDAFFQLMHGRMQDLANSGSVNQMLSEHAQARRTAMLEAQIRASGQTPVTETAND